MRNLVWDRNGFMDMLKIYITGVSDTQEQNIMEMDDFFPEEKLR